MKNFFDKLVCMNSQSFYKEMETNLLKQKRMFIVTANPETFMHGEKDTEFARLLLDDETTIVPDGIGIVKVANLLDYPIQERIPGVEIAQKLLEYAEKHQLSVCLFGAKPEVIEKMKEVLKNQYPNARLVYAVDGYQKDKDAVMEKIQKLHADIILVAMGIPAQEKLIYRHLKDFDKGIFVGVGGSFDVMSGMKKRAPKIFIKCNLEWLYRLACEPSRIKRFYNNNIQFVKKARKLKKERSS